MGDWLVFVRGHRWPLLVIDVPSAWEAWSRYADLPVERLEEDNLPEPAPCPPGRKRAKRKEP